LGRFVSNATYSGEYLDLSSGNYYLRARYYNPAIGRFLTEDSMRSTSRTMQSGQNIVDPLSLNLYAYCWNNPIRYIDPTGNHPAVGILEQIAYSPAGQQIIQQLQIWADQAGVAIETFILNNPSLVQQLVDLAGTVGPAVYDYFASGQVGRDLTSAKDWIVDKASGAYNSVKNWFGGGSSSPGGPDWNSINKAIKEIENITAKYGNLKCTDTANDIKNYLTKNSLNGVKIELKDPFERGIWSNTYNGVVSQNGYHVGTYFNGLVYDNIHKTGIPLEQWYKDFSGIGQFIIRRNPF